MGGACDQSPPTIGASGIQTVFPHNRCRPTFSLPSFVMSESFGLAGRRADGRVDGSEHGDGMSEHGREQHGDGMSEYERAWGGSVSGKRSQQDTDGASEREARVMQQ